MVAVGLSMAGLAMFVACGSDSPSGVSDDNTRVVSASVDEASQLITLYVNESEQFCVRSENNTFTWKSVKMADDTMHWGYKFANDTLIIIQNPGSSYEYGMVLTGGTAGKLYGTWTMSHACYYDDNEIECDDDDSNNYVYTYKFSKSSITAKRTYVNSESEEDDEDESSDDFMNSTFMKYFFYSIYMEDEFDQYIWALRWEDSSAVQSYSLIYPVSSKTKNKMTFTADGKEVTVNVNEWNLDEENDSFTAKVTVYSGTKTCTLEYASVEMSSAYCKAENAPYFDIDTEEDAYGYEFSYADEYEKDNTDEFNECLNEMFYGVSDAKVLNKKLNASSVDHKKLAKVQREFYKAVKNLQK